MAINAAAVWRVRPSGSNTNGGGYDSTIAGAGTDYSQQNSAQASGTHGTGTSAVFTDATASAFTSAMVGNAMFITGGGATTGFYFVVGFTSATVVTLDRSPGTYTNATWLLGGGWADFWTNTNSSGQLVAGNTVYILGSGIPNPASYTYDYTGVVFTPMSGSNTAGYFTLAGDPATPSGGVPCIKVPGLEFFNASLLKLQNLWFVASGAVNGNAGVTNSNGVVIGCTFDQFGFDVTFGTGATTYIGCEVTSSVSGSSHANSGIVIGAAGGAVYGCNIHDCLAVGLVLQAAGHAAFNVISKNYGTGVYVTDSGSDTTIQQLYNNTIDNNLGHGIEFVTQRALAITACFNNIIANHTASSTYGMTADAGTLAANDRVKQFVDYNTFYNNTTNYNAISAGAHDTASSTNPFANEAANDWTLTASFYNAGVTPSGALPQQITGWNG